MLKNKKSFFLTATILSVFSSIVSADSIIKEPNVYRENVSMSCFSDVQDADWFYENVKYVSENDLMTGTSESTFSPNLTTTRGMIVTILWRLEKNPISTRECSFTDINSNMYYYNAIKWASSENIVSGYDNDHFGPDDNVSREQLSTILYRYMSYKSIDVSHSTNDLSSYADFEQVEPYAVKAITWATESGIITGISQTELSPKSSALRCQVATLLKRICEKYHIIEGIDYESPKHTDKNTSHNSSSNSQSNDKTTSGASTSTGEKPSIDSDKSDEKSVIINANAAHGTPGEVIDFTLDLKNNPGILGMVLSLEYDESAMTLIAVENGDAVSDVLTLTPSKSLNSGARFVWDGLDVNFEDIKDGTLLTLKFKIFDNATIGKTFPLKFSYNSGDIVDSNLNEVNPQIIQSFLEIEKCKTSN